MGTIAMYLADIENLNGRLRHDPALYDENFGAAVSVNGWEHIVTTITEEGELIATLDYSVSTHAAFWDTFIADIVDPTFTTDGTQTSFSDRLTHRPIAQLHPTELSYGYLTCDELADCDTISTPTQELSIEHTRLWEALVSAIRAARQHHRDLIAIVE